MNQLLRYFSLIKFSHTIFALPFAFVGFFLAFNGLKQDQQSVSILTATIVQKLILMLICMVCARSAAMAFNRVVDKKFDLLNERTKSREIPSGKITSAAALIFTFLSCLTFITATYFINSLCFYLSPIALLVVLGYSYTKRFTALCHLILGLGLGLAPIGAYLVISGSFDILPVLFSLAVIFWVSGFDIIYALQDEHFDKQHELKSIPSVFGAKKALYISRLFHVLSTLFIVMSGFIGDFHPVYWIGTLLFAFFLFYQHRLVKINDLSKVNLAFFTMNGVASIVFGIITVIALFFR